MPHFASANWSDMFGKGVRLHNSISPALFLAVAESPKAGATEGSDLLTYVVPAGESGLYLVAASLHVDVVSNAGTSQTLEFNVAYNDGAAVTTTSLGELNAGQSTGNTNVVIDLTSANARIQQHGIVRLEAGTTITVATQAVNGGTIATTGAMDIDMLIMNLG